MGTKNEELRTKNDNKEQGTKNGTGNEEIDRPKLLQKLIAGTLP
jgi:hypothetical protein